VDVGNSLGAAPVSLNSFAKAMDVIVTGEDLETVKRDGMKLIVEELGAGVPGYLPWLEKFANRLEELTPKRQPKTPSAPL